MEGLQGKAANKEGAVTLLGLVSYTIDNTRRRVLDQYRQRQVPYLRGDMTDFVLANVAVAPPVREPATVSLPNPISNITAPVATYLTVKERLVLQQVDHAMNLYKAENNRVPASNEEFMREIIQKNGIRLPRLPDAHEYVYDPSDGVLKVRKPRDAP